MTVFLRSVDVRAHEDESHGVSTKVNKALVPQRSFSTRGTDTFVSKKGSVLTGKNLKVRKIVVLHEDEVAMWVAGKGLSDGTVMETDDVVPVLEMLLIYDAWGTAFGHVGRVGSPNAKLTGVAVFIDKVELDDPAAKDVNIDAFDVDGGAKPGVVAREKGGTVGLENDVGTGVDEAELGWRNGYMSAESRLGLIRRRHVGR
jgi:hypothetical protein